MVVTITHINIYDIPLYLLVDLYIVPSLIELVTKLNLGNIAVDHIKCLKSLRNSEETVATDEEDIFQFTSI